MKTIYTKEYAVTIIDIIEDFLSDKGIIIPNEDRDMVEDAENCAIIYGEDFDFLLTEISEALGYLVKDCGATDVNTEVWEN